MGRIYTAEFEDVAITAAPVPSLVFIPPKRLEQWMARAIQARADYHYKAREDFRIIGTITPAPGTGSLPPVKARRHHGYYRLPVSRLRRRVYFRPLAPVVFTEIVFRNLLFVGARSTMMVLPEDNAKDIKIPGRTTRVNL